jgi:hypothetical protein
MTETPEAIAKARFKKLTMVRIYGVVIAIIGAAIIAGKTALPPILGIIILIIGAFDTLALPPIMIRRWKKADGAQK